jgi:hypothetical protein
MRRLLLLAALLVPSAARAQSPDHEAAYAVITKLFDGMRTRDTTAMRAAFASSARLQSLSATGVSAVEISSWIGSVGSAPAGLVLDERLANPIVQVSGDLASVWVDYWFFAGERFSHCGVDAFVLARQGGEWKIISVADTRRREGCAPAPTPAR